PRPGKQTPPPLRGGLGQPGGEPAQVLEGGGLARVLRVGPVGVEGLPGEVRGRHELGEEALGRDLRVTADEPADGGRAGARGRDIHERQAYGSPRPWRAVCPPRAPARPAGYA